MAEYKYFCKARPPAPGAIPKRNIIEAVAEHVPIPDSHRFYWGWATFSEPLTDEEIDFYELAKAWLELPRAEWTVRIEQPGGLSALEFPAPPPEIVVKPHTMESRGQVLTVSEHNTLTVRPLLPVYALLQAHGCIDTPPDGIWQDAVDYVHKQIHATQHALAKAQEKPGVTRAEMENLEHKLAVLDWLARLAIDKGEYV